MNRRALFKKWYKHKEHDYEITETLQYTDETGRKPDICWIYSGRNRGKSFEVDTNVIADAYYDNRLFAYVRRHETTNYDVEAYFEDKKAFVRDMTDGARDGITKDTRKIYLYHIEHNESTGKYKRVLDECIGYFFPLENESDLRSLQYPDIYNMIYEEVLTNKRYLPAEPDLLMNLISTLKRNKKDFRVWLISNTVSIVNPYSNAWGLNLARNKAGEVHLSKLYLRRYDENGEEEYLLIASHYLVNKDELSEEDKKKDRNRIKTGISSNTWDELFLYKTVPLSFIRRYEIIDTVVFEYEDIMMQVDLLEVPVNMMDVYRYCDEEEYDEAESDKTIIIGYVRRKTTEPHEGTRVYTNNNKRFNDYTTIGFQMIYKIDRIIYDLKKVGWLVGADNLTMNDFYRIWDNLRNPFAY